MDNPYSGSVTFLFRTDFQMYSFQIESGIRVGVRCDSPWEVEGGVVFYVPKRGIVVKGSLWCQYFVSLHTPTPRRLICLLRKSRKGRDFHLHSPSLHSFTGPEIDTSVYISIRNILRQLSISFWSSILGSFCLLLNFSDIIIMEVLLLFQHIVLFIREEPNHPFLIVSVLLPFWLMTSTRLSLLTYPPSVIYYIF